MIVPRRQRHHSAGLRGCVFSTGGQDMGTLDARGVTSFHRINETRVTVAYSTQRTHRHTNAIHDGDFAFLDRDSSSPLPTSNPPIRAKTSGPRNKHLL